MNGKLYPIGIQSSQFHNVKWFTLVRIQIESTRNQLGPTEYSNQYIRTVLLLCEIKIMSQWNIREYNDTETGSSRDIES